MSGSLNNKLPMRRDKRDLADALSRGDTIEEAARYLLRSGTVGDVARIAGELELDYNNGRYSIELFREGGEGAGREMILARETRLDVARGLFYVMCAQFSGCLIMLCDGGRILRRSDRPSRQQ